MSVNFEISQWYHFGNLIVKYSDFAHYLKFYKNRPVRNLMSDFICLSILKFPMVSLRESHSEV